MYVIFIKYLTVLYRRATSVASFWKIIVWAADLVDFSTRNWTLPTDFVSSLLYRIHNIFIHCTMGGNVTYYTRIYTHTLGLTVVGGDGDRMDWIWRQGQKYGEIKHYNIIYHPPPSARSGTFPSTPSGHDYVFHVNIASVVLGTICTHTRVVV